MQVEMELLRLKEIYEIGIEILSNGDENIDKEV